MKLKTSFATALITALVAITALTALPSCTTGPDGSVNFQPTPEQFSAAAALIAAAKAKPVRHEK